MNIDLSLTSIAGVHKSQTHGLTMTKTHTSYTSNSYYTILI